MKRKYFDEYDCSSRLYCIWKHMKERCHSKNCKDFANYGARGISVCDEWKNDFLSFKKWALENGYNEALTLDRIDSNGNYEPTNCRFATRKEQNNNKRDNHYLTHNGETKTLSEWSKETGLNVTTILMRISKYKWSVEKALTTQSRKRGASRCD